MNQKIYEVVNEFSYDSWSTHDSFQYWLNKYLGILVNKYVDEIEKKLFLVFITIQGVSQNVNNTPDGCTRLDILTSYEGCAAGSGLEAEILKYIKNFNGPISSHTLVEFRLLLTQF